MRLTKRLYKKVKILISRVIKVINPLSFVLSFGSNLFVFILSITYWFWWNKIRGIESIFPDNLFIILLIIIVIPSIVFIFLNFQNFAAYLLGITIGWMSIYNIDEFWRHSLLLDFKKNLLIIIIILLLDSILLYLISYNSLSKWESRKLWRAFVKFFWRFTIGGMYSISLGGLLVYALIGTTPEIFGYFESETYQNDFTNVVKKWHKDFYQRYLKEMDVKTVVKPSGDSNPKRKDAIHECLKEKKAIFSLIAKVVYFGSLLSIMIGIFSTGIVDIFKKGP